MKTDDLIRALAADPSPQVPVTHRLWRRLALSLAASVALLGLAFGYRADLGAALLTPAPALRLALALAIFGAGLRISLDLARPGGTVRGRSWPLLSLAGGAGLLVAWALAVTPPSDWSAAVLGSTPAACLFGIVALSILPVAALLLALRHGATGNPSRLGAMAGLTGSAAAAAVYVLHCTEDSPLFYIVWSGLAMALVTAASARIGARLLRW